MISWKRKAWLYILVATQLGLHAPLASALPTYFNMQWGLFNDGSRWCGDSDNSCISSTRGADIKALDAWNISDDCSDAPIALLDTGVDATHPDLEGSIIAQVTHIPDGYVQDKAKDDNGHGTHAAGTIAANGNGIWGVCHQSKLIVAKVLDKRGIGDDYSIIEGLEFAIRHKAKVINLSLGDENGCDRHSDWAKIYQDTLAKASVLVVASSGNEGQNTDVSPSFPACLHLPHMITVAATDFNDQLAGFSNFGSDSVDLAAPGVNIYSTMPTYMTDYMRLHRVSTGYAAFDGTSSAAPFVSGAAALYWSNHPGSTVETVRQRILETVDPLSSLIGKVSSGGRLNLFKLMSSD